MKHTFYMHTVNGLPAIWDEEHGQLRIPEDHEPVTLQRSEEKAVEQKNKTIEKRASAGLPVSLVFEIKEVEVEL